MNDNPHEPPQIESEGCDISHNALYSHQIDLVKNSNGSEKLFYIYQHFQDSEKKCCILIQENKTWHKVLKILY